MLKLEKDFLKVSFKNNYRLYIYANLIGKRLLVYWFTFNTANSPRATIILALENV